MKLKNVDVCIYHNPCPDGFGAAWAVHKKFPKSKLIPGNYAKNSSNSIFDVCKDKNVVCVDYSFDRNTTKKLSNICKTFNVIDHHITAAGKIGDLPYCHFDMAHSGAVLAWKACYRSKPPKLLQYVEDRDLWNFSLPKTQEASAYIQALPYEIEAWNHAHTLFESDINKVFSMGEAILMRVKAMINHSLENVETWHIAGHEIKAINCDSPSLRSELCHELLNKYPDSPFAGCYNLKEGVISWSLRSENNREDVAKIASLFGGGGHRNASGFSKPFSYKRVINK